MTVHVHLCLYSTCIYSQVDEATYRSTIERVNEYFSEAESLGCCNALEGCLSCMTGFALHYCFKTHYERVRKTTSAISLLHTILYIVLWLGLWVLLNHFLFCIWPSLPIYAVGPLNVPK